MSLTEIRYQKHKQWFGGTLERSQASKVVENFSALKSQASSSFVAFDTGVSVLLKLLICQLVTKCVCLIVR
jgi:hypothetical protein